MLRTISRALQIFSFALISIYALQMSAASSASSQPYNTNKPKRLLILNSYNESAPWTQRMITPVLKEASDRTDVACAVQHINMTYITNDSIYDQMADAVFHRYAEWKPNMVICIGNAAFCMRERIKQEWGEIPMVVISEIDSVSLDRSYYYTGQPSELYLKKRLEPMEKLRQEYNFTHIAAPSYIRETVDMMVKMVPNMKRLVFAADEMYNNQRYERIVQQRLKERYPNLIYERVVASPEGEELLKNYLLSPAGKEAAVLFSTWFYKAKTLYGFNTLISGDYRLITYSPRPVFCLRHSYLNENGFLGGYFYDLDETLAHFLAGIKDMMDGKSMRNIPFYKPSEGLPYVDYSQIDKDEVELSDCPEDTVFINRAPSFWELYHWYVLLVAIIVLVIVAALMLVLYVQRKKADFHASHSTLLRNMPIFYTQGKVEFDKQGNAQSVTYTSGNYASQQIFAENATEKGKNSLFELQYILQFAEMALKERHIVSFTHFFKQTNSFYEFVVCPSSERNTIDIFGMNATARHEAEISLREANQKLELTLSVAKIIPWTWDLESNMITCEEQRILNAMNFNHQPDNDGSTVMMAKEYFQRIHPEDQLRLKEIFKSVLCGDIDHIRTEYRIVSQIEGRQRIDWVEVNGVAEHKGDDMRPYRISGSLLLITERKRQERILIEAKNKAAESDKLKSAFLANVSHEIRTPLNAIIGFSNLLNVAETAEERQEYIGIIENNNQLLLQLISDILDLSKIESGSFDIHDSVVDLNELMFNVQNTVQHRVKPTVLLECQQGAEHCHVLTDRNRVTQVLVNMLNNATKFTSVGNITFGYEIRPDQKQLYFYVKDTGEGIAPENQRRIFERFVKVNSFIQGTGLGLAICQSIVQQMQGQIGVQSDGLGLGSTFWFTLPYKPTKPVVATTPRLETAEKQEMHDKITILVAEDNPDNFHLLQSLLEKQYTVIHAWDGQEAIDIFNAQSPNIIIMDINMPKVDGYEAAKAIRAIDSNVPIIAVTAYAYDSDKERILQSGFDDYISKPLSAKKLNDTLTGMVHRNFVML